MKNYIKIKNKTYIEIKNKDKGTKLHTKDLKNSTDWYKSIKTKTINGINYFETIDSDGDKCLYTINLTNLINYYKLIKTIIINKINYYEIIYSNGNKTIYSTDLKTSIYIKNNELYITNKKIKPKTLNKINYIETIDSDGDKKLYTSDLKNSTDLYKSITTKTINGIKYIEIIKDMKGEFKYIYTLNLKNNNGNYGYQTIKRIKINNITYIQTTDTTKIKRLYDKNLINKTKKLLKINNFYKLYDKNINQLNNNLNINKIAFIEIKYLFLETLKYMKELYTSDLKNSIDITDKQIKQITINNIEYIQTTNKEGNKKLYEKNLKLVNKELLKNQKQTLLKRKTKQLKSIFKTKPDKTLFSFLLQTSLKEKINKLSKENNLSKANIINQILNNYFDNN